MHPSVGLRASHSDGSVTKFADSRSVNLRQKSAEKYMMAAGLDPDLSVKTETVSALTIE